LVRRFAGGNDCEEKSRWDAAKPSDTPAGRGCNVHIASEIVVDRRYGLGDAYPAEFFGMSENYSLMTVF